MAILLGFKEENTSTSEYGSVNHQRTDVIKEGTTKELTEFYEQSIKNSKIASKRISKIFNDLEFSTMSEKEFEREQNQYHEASKVSKYDRVIIVEGSILK